MDKSPDAFRTISEVADLLDTPAHVLRFWESRFPQVRPVKRAGGRRYYRPGDVALLSGIRKLLHDDGMTIRGVQKILREQGVRHVAGLGGEGTGIEDPLDIEAMPAVEDAIEATPRHAPAQVVHLSPAMRRPTETAAQQELLFEAAEGAEDEPSPAAASDDPPAETAGVTEITPLEEMASFADLAGAADPVPVAEPEAAATAVVDTGWADASTDHGSWAAASDEPAPPVDDYADLLGDDPANLFSDGVSVQVDDVTGTAGDPPPPAPTHEVAEGEGDTDGDADDDRDDVPEDGLVDEIINEIIASAGPDLGAIVEAELAGATPALSPQQPLAGHLRALPLNALSGRAEEAAYLYHRLTQLRDRMAAAVRSR